MTGKKTCQASRIMSLQEVVFKPMLLCNAKSKTRLCLSLPRETSTQHQTAAITAQRQHTHISTYARNAQALPPPYHSVYRPYRFEASSKNTHP